MSFLEFYGEDCPHCKEMHPLVEKLEAELGIQVEKYEVWGNEENSVKKEKYDTGLCGGVPFFFNTETGQHICGSTDYESLKGWAIGE